jgi:hypothetical protein
VLDQRRIDQILEPPREDRQVTLLHSRPQEANPRERRIALISTRLELIHSAQKMRLRRKPVVSLCEMNGFLKLTIRAGA